MSDEAMREGLDVFISYASADRERVLPIVADLEAAGLNVWFDRQKIEGGTRWGREIVLGVRACRVFALMCSDASMRSRAVAQEIQLAWQYEKPYLPLLLEQTNYPEQVEFFLGGWHWIEVLDLPREKWLPQLLQALEHADVSVTGVAESEDTERVEAVRPRLSLEGLRAVARFTDQIWPVAAERAMRAPGASTLRDLGAPQDDVQHGYRVGSRVALAIESDRGGHLLLLDEGTSGKVYCLCPSWFAPDTHLEAGRSYLPQGGAAYKSFEVSGDPGREHLLAIIADEPLDLDWMPSDPKVPARVLSREDVSLLLESLRDLEGDRWVALSTYFDVLR